MDGRQVTQQGLLTDRETGNASEKQDGNPSEKERERPDRSRPFSLLGNLLFISLHVLIRMAFLIFQTKHAHTSSHFQIQNLRLMLRRFKITMWSEKQKTSNPLRIRGFDSSSPDRSLGEGGLD